jgi:hypothetical protein
MLLEATAAFFDYMAKRPRFVRLISWEGLEGGAISRSLWADVSGPLFRGVASLIAAAQQHGVLDAKLHPGHLVISLMGIVTPQVASGYYPRRYLFKTNWPGTAGLYSVADVRRPADSTTAGRPIFKKTG